LSFFKKKVSILSKIIPISKREVTKELYFVGLLQQKFRCPFPSYFKSSSFNSAHQILIELRTVLEKRPGHYPQETHRPRMRQMINTPLQSNMVSTRDLHTRQHFQAFALMELWSGGRARH
jgi:hypothetical protein